MSGVPSMCLMNVAFWMEYPTVIAREGLVYEDIIGWTTLKWTAGIGQIVKLYLILKLWYTPDSVI